MHNPAEGYRPSTRPYCGIGEFEHLFHDKTVTVTQCRRVRYSGQKAYLSTVFAGQNFGISQVDNRIWQLGFMQSRTGG